MLHRELRATIAVKGGARWEPAITQAEGISEGGLVQSETMLGDWECRQPARGTFLLSQGHCPLQGSGELWLH